MKIITSEEFLNHSYTDSIAFEIMKDGGLRLIAETEDNENEDEEDYTDYRINYYNWLCEWQLNGNNSLIDLILEERGNRCGGIYLINEEDAFAALLEYFDDNEYTVILCENDEETKKLLPILAPGYYLITMPRLLDGELQAECNKFYVLAGRYGTELTEAFGSLCLRDVQKEMKTLFKAACKEEKENESFDDGEFEEMSATVMTSNSDWHEWRIHEFDLTEIIEKSK